MWTGPNGERPLLPKDEGSGVMISSFITREHGLIREIDDYILTTVNANRLGASYADEEAAIDVHGTKKKKPLTKKILHSWSTLIMEKIEMATGITITWCVNSKTQLMY